MAKQILVDLVFNANTQQAKQQMRQLQNSVQQVQNVLNSQVSMQGLTKELSKAQDSVIALKTNLTQAFNVDTGRLNMNKFVQNMKISGQSIKQYRESLQLLGADGIKAFNQLSQAVVNAEMPLQRSKNLLTTMMDTFGNSIKWSVAYGAINKFSQGMSDAFKYAQDLNTSLTNIRVITGQSADEMAKFAEQANKAAKSLSTTTTEYTKAALIYYRQGLDAQQVEDRVKTTLKLANVTGETAQTVSEWMTAIWNNFDDGNKKLEYYADVMARLGVETASSADEIAKGFEKFAAVAETVGLSYEYGASAIAAVTAQTRQSADVVGTAFKTLFARIQDLNLGNTLDDGTTLGQYSEALNKVGIQIKDVSGNLRDMDDILDDMGATWKKLSNDEQVALAKSVAGIRQYTQLVSLMNNYDYFKQLTESAETAEGTLEKQQKVWAESWEAASKRVKAAAEGLFDSLIDDKFFVSLENTFADLLSDVNELLKAMGGLRSLLPMIAGLILRAFGPAAIGAVSGFWKNITGPSAAQRAEAHQGKMEVLNQQRIMAYQSDSAVGKAVASINPQHKEFVTEVENISRHLNQNEIERLQTLRQTITEEENYLIKLAEELDLQDQITDSKAETYQNAKKETENIKDKILQSKKYSEAQKKAAVEAMRLADEDAKRQARLQEITNRNYLTERGNFSKAAATKAYREFDPTFKGEIQSQEQLKALSANFDPSARALKTLDNAKLDKRLKLTKTLTKSIQEQAAASKDWAVENNKSAKQWKIVNDVTEHSIEVTKDAVKEAKALQKIPLGQRITATASAFTSLASSVSMVYNGFSGLVNMFKEGNITFGSILSSVTSLAMGITMLSPALSSLTTALGLSTVQINANNIATAKNLLLNKDLTAEEAKQQVATLLGIETKNADVVVENLSNMSKGKQLLVSKALTAQHILEALGLKALIPVELSEALAAKDAAISTSLLVGQIALLLGVLALAVGAIIGVVYAVKALSNAYNADAIAAEKANKAYKEQQELVKSVKDEYDALKKSIEDYTNAQKAISQMTEGTLEWKKAIQESNQQVIELLDKYPELQKYVANVNGRLLINAEGQEAILEQQGQRLTTQQNIEQDLKIAASRTQYQADRTAAIRGELDTHNLTTFGVGVGMLNPLVSASIFAIEEAVTEKIANEALDKIEQAYAEQGETIFADFNATLADLGIKDQRLVETLTKNVDVTQELVRTNQKIAEQADIAIQQKVDNLLLSQSHFISANYGAGVQQQARKLYNQYLNNSNIGNFDSWTYSDWATKPGMWNIFGILPTAIWHGFDTRHGTAAGEEAFKKYAEGMGFKNADVTDWMGKGSGVRFTYEDEDGRKELVKSYEEIETALKEMAATSRGVELANRVNEMTSTVRKLANSEDAVLQAIGSFFEHGDLSYLDPEIYDQMSGMAGKSADAINEYAKEFGYSGKEINELIKEFNSNIKNYDADLATLNIATEQRRKYNEIIAAGVEELKISQTALEDYSIVLAQNSNALKENTADVAKMAVANYRTAIGLKDLKKVFLDNATTLKDTTANTLSYMESLAAVQDQIEKTFGLKVTAEFVETNLEDIEKLANDDVEALDKLRKALIEDYIFHLEIADDYKTELQNALNDLMSQVENADNNIGMTLTLDNQKAIEGINEALQQGKTTVKEIEALFANANLVLPQFNMAKIPQETTTESWVSTGPENGPLTTTYSRAYTVNWIDVPYFGNNPPTYERDTTKKVSELQEGESLYKLKEGTGVESNKLKGIKIGGNAQTAADLVGYSTETAQERDKRIRDNNKEKDRYHQINEIISDTERALQALSKAKDKAYGQSKIALLDNEIAKQKELIANNKILLAETENYYKLDRAELLKNYAVTLDSSGRISNYEKIEDEFIRKINKQPQNEQLQQDYEKFKQLASQYETTLNKWEEQVEKVQDEMDKLASYNLERIKYTVEIKVDMTADDKAYIEFLMQTVENDAFKAAQAIELMTDSAVAAVKDIAAYEEAISQIPAMVENGELTPQDAIELLREYRDNVIDLNSELLELRQNVQDKLTEAFDAWNEKLDKSREKLEFLSDTLEHYRNIIDLVGKDTLGISDETIKQMNETRLSVAQNELRAAMAQKEENDRFLEEAREARDQAIDEESRKEWDKQIEIAEEKSREYAKIVQDNLTDALQVVKDNFQTTAKQIADNFSKSVSGVYDSIEEMRQSWDRQQEIEDRYLKDYEKVYEINKLNRQIQNEMDKSSNLGTTQKLRDFQQEMLEMSKDGEKLSKYDLEYLQKKHDLLVAEAALQDAQNAKSVVRLQRDSEGRFGYVYTADQSAVDNAQQNYEDKLKAYQDFSYKMDKELNERALALNEWVYDQIQRAAELYGVGSQKYQEEVQKIYQKYYEDMQYITDEYEKLTGRNLDINRDFNAGVAAIYNDTFLGKIYPDYQSFAGLFEDTTGLCEDAVASLQGSMDTYQANVEDTLNLAGLDMQNFEKTVLDEYGKIEKESTELADQIDKDSKAMASDLQEVIKKVQSFQSAYDTLAKDIRNQTQTMIEKIAALAEKYGTLAAKMQEVKSLEGQGNNSGSGNGYTPITNTEAGKIVESAKTAYENNRTTSQHTVTDIVKDSNAQYYIVDNTAVYTKNQLEALDERDKNIKIGKNVRVLGTGQALYNIDKQSYLVETFDQNGKTTGAEMFAGHTIFVLSKDDTTGLLTIVDLSNGKQQFRITQTDLELLLKGHFSSSGKLHGGGGGHYSFDTGGYTGAWGPEGRLAMLHQKELVLNAQDTENFLAAIGIVRDISDQIEKNAIAMRYQSAIGSYNAAVPGTNGAIQQNITIQAEFPNATNHSEIEEAFRNLSNFASQYTNRKS